MKNIKFEYILTVLVLVSLLAALIIFKTDKEIVKSIIQVFTTGFASMMVFFFTKYTPTNKSFMSNDPVTPKEINPVNTTNDIK